MLIFDHIVSKSNRILVISSLKELERIEGIFINLHVKSLVVYHEGKIGTVSSKMSTKLLVFVLLISINFVHCVLFEEELSDEARKKKDKYLYPIILGGLIVKAIIFPLAFKFMAIMSSVAVMLSIMSLIVSSIVGYVKVAIKPNHPAVKVIHLNDWSKDDYGYDVDWPFQSEPVYSSRRVKY